MSGPRGYSRSALQYRSAEDSSAVENIFGATGYVSWTSPRGTVADGAREVFVNTGAHVLWSQSAPYLGAAVVNKILKGTETRRPPRGTTDHV
jgi:hypothetical protein